MHLLEFFKTESDTPKGPILAMAVISGLANSLILASINAGAEAVSARTEIEVQLFLMYLVSLALFIYARKASLSQATVAVEEAVRKVRVRIADKIRRSELSFIESTEKTDVYTYLTQDTNLISQSAVVIIAGAQSAIVLLFCVLYIAWLSTTGLVLTLLTLGSAILIYRMHYTTLNEELNETVTKETEFFGKLSQVLDGFKEIKINRRKSDDLFRHIEQVAYESQRLKVSTGLKFVVDIMFSRVSSNILLGVVVFIMPIFSVTHVDVVVKISATILFLMGPLETIVAALPVFMRADVAVYNIQRLERELDEATRQAYTVDTHSDEDTFREFKSLRLDNATFQYTDREGKALFGVGPLDLTIRRGEIIYIVGGNGSGKSTLLKLLIGLYYPLSGAVMVDDEDVDQETYADYRELFSIIFTDFHLFDRLYGQEKVDKQRLKELLRIVELDKKTRYVDGAFTNINLSTGQKKRLAFVASVLEDKPIYIFDELAADQDPHFRRYFYEVLLPELRARDKTIIAVTHDDRYFHTADRVLKMEYGQIASIEEPHA